MNTNGTITGVAHVSNSTCYAYATPISLTGTQDTKGNLTLTGAATAGQVLSVAGVATGTGSQISGTYQIAGGCAAGDKGTVGGFVIPDISATYKGTLLSKTGTQIGTSVQVVQAPVDSNGFFHFTANATFTGSPCFTSASLTSTGNSVLNGNQIAGYLTGTGTAPAQIFLSGLVSVVPGAAPTGLLVSSYSVVGGLCSGDTGAGNLTRE